MGGFNKALNERVTLLSEIKTIIHQRIHNEGKFEEYALKRDMLKASGVPVTEAWRLAAYQFPPADGSPHELDAPGIPPVKSAAPRGVPAGHKKRGPGRPRKIREDQNGSVNLDKPQTPQVALAAPDPPAAWDEDWFLDTRAEVASEGRAVSVPKEGDEGVGDDNSVALTPAQQRARERLSGSRAVGPTANESKSAVALANRSAEQTEWDRLAEAVDPGREAGFREVVEWVFNNTMTPLAKIDPEAVPSMGALQLCKWARSNTKDYGEFVKSVWSRLVPAKAEVEAASRYTDDGREQLDLLEGFERSLEAELDKVTRGTAT